MREEKVKELEENLKESKIIIKNLLEEVKDYERKFKKNI